MRSTTGGLPGGGQAPLAAARHDETLAPIGSATAQPGVVWAYPLARWGGTMAADLDWGFEQHIAILSADWISRHARRHPHTAHHRRCDRAGTGPLAVLIVPRTLSIEVMGTEVLTTPITLLSIIKGMATYIIVF